MQLEGRATKAPRKAQPVSLFLYQAGIFLNFCRQTIAFDAQGLGDALLSLHSAFSQRRRKVEGEGRREKVSLEWDTRRVELCSAAVTADSLLFCM